MNEPNIVPGYDVSAMDNRADAQLVDELLARSEAALRRCMDLYSGVVYGMARRVVAEPSLAEEVAQDTFLALWRRPGSYDPERGSLQSWLVGVARNKAIDLVRREESLRKAKNALISEAQVESAEGPTFEPTIGIDERQAVKTALQALSEVQREALVLAYFGGRTYREVAVELGIPEGTAKTRLRDGLLRLRELMGTGGGSRER